MPEETASASTAKSMEEKPCSSTAAADSTVDVSEEAKKLIGTGNRHLVMGDVVSAVSAFQEACAMLAEQYGDTADECGEAFFLCGKALLELARMENTVLGNALEGVPEESSVEGEKQNDSKIESADNLDEKTRDELRAQVYDAMSEETSTGVQKEQEDDEQEEAEKKPKEGGQKKSTEEEGGDQKQHEKKEDVKVRSEEDAPKTEQNLAENKAEKSNGALEREDASGSNGVSEKAEKDKEATENQNGNDEPMEEEGRDDDDDDDDDDDENEDEEEGGTKDKESEEEEEVGNLQLAWEMLEVAKVIYKRKESKEDQLMAAQIYLKLGEVGAESGNYSQSLEDFNECLTLQLKHLPSHSRLLAETHYQLGTTYSYTAQYSKAIEHFSSSIKVIESRLAMLQVAIEKAEGAETAQEKSELEELKQLLPEITEKIEDAKESQRTAATASAAIHQTLASCSAAFDSTCGGASTSAFPAENGPSSSTARQIDVRPADVASSSKSASDISHLVRKKRKPDEESPKKDSDAKKTKQETSVNGSDDSARNGVPEKMEPEPSNSSSVETSA
ncbi:nuclear autoantigenic sperm protein isoform X2 [Triplophysa rosa]|uniref:nuclear autoantigenic sperm protein isoform X2 n=1 Tax=Triplophysa rosa TaxID=992332 RepID=UPI002545D0D8|nr:nuclear autoantigenic sperm protein isoform X2 [Triplophysa rosa]